MWFGFTFFFIIQMWLSNTCYFIMCTFRSFNVIYHQCLELLWVPFKNYRTRFFFLSFLVFFFFSVWVKCFSNQSLEMQMESPSVWLLLCAGNIDKCFIDSCWVRLPVVILKPFYFYFLCMDVLACICMCLPHVHNTCGGQKRVMDPLYLELKTVLRLHVGAGNATW